MNPVAEIFVGTDLLMNLLVAQCEDLESLLVLSRDETQAVQEHNFDQIIRITAERATVGERLEMYQQQIVDLRTRLGQSEEMMQQNPTVIRINELVSEVQAQDEQTRVLLLHARQQLEQEQRQLNQMQRGLTAYGGDHRMPAVACDQLA